MIPGRARRAPPWGRRGLVAAFFYLDLNGRTSVGVALVSPRGVGNRWCYTLQAESVHASGVMEMPVRMMVFYFGFPYLNCRPVKKRRAGPRCFLGRG